MLEKIFQLKKNHTTIKTEIIAGITMGVIAYVVLNLICGKIKEKKISVLMVILAILFILKYIFL